jgi:hypothetical protein
MSGSGGTAEDDESVGDARLRLTIGDLGRARFRGIFGEGLEGNGDHQQ